jgi:membrane-associated phospholipid phosphatase
MRFDSVLLLLSGVAGSVLGAAALIAGVHGVGAVLCALVFAIAAACLYVGWRFWAESPLTRFRQRQAAALPLRLPPHA